jgi:PPE-repeat protein
MLVATNFLGINTAAIMATEAQYAEMWAQDAAAMYGYAGSSAAAATLTPFTPPQQNTNPAGLAAQNAAVANSGGTQTSTSVDVIIQQILADINKALEPDTVNSGISAFATVPSIILSAVSALSTGSNSAATAAASTVAALTDVSTGLSKVATNLGSVGAAPVGGAVSAGLARAASVGALSVPPAWGTLAVRMAPPPMRYRSASSAKPGTWRRCRRRSAWQARRGQWQAARGCGVNPLRERLCAL